MKTKSSNKNLRKASKAKKDEFYTQLTDIEKELKHYKKYLKGKIVYCNCDDPFESNFFKYFAANFNVLELKKLITTSYLKSSIVGGQLPLFEVEGLKPEGKEPFRIEINEVKDFNSDGAISLADVEWLLKRDANVAKPLKGNGDFRSEECIEMLKEADIVVTNPPFSLFREYVAQLMEYNKKFLILGDQNAITYKDIFSYIKENKLWLGYDNGGTKWFQVPIDYDISTESRKKIEDGVKYFSMGRILWFTNLDTSKRHEDLILYKKYTPEEYPKYDNYGAINVDKVAETPMGYEGSMGVPITFMDKYNPDQFEIIALGIVGSIDFACNKKMEILKDGEPTGKFTYNAKGTLYRLYNSKLDKKTPAFRDVETGELYSSIYARIIIKNKKITVRELTNGFEDNDENGVVGYSGKLDIRPPYQREFIYKDKQRDAVIDTVTKEFPLNVMYWAVREDGNFEIIDGQQRTISVCQYVNGDFSVSGLAFHNLQNDKKEQILNYKLMIYFCSGADSEKLEWFKIINIAGERLTDQELRNAVYSGSWVTDVKRYFSKSGCAAYGIGSDYLNGSPIRQEYLETAIKWISNGKIEEYMSEHQHDQNAAILWRYFQDVITWAETTFTKKRKFMKGVDWGTLYNKYKDGQYNTKEIEKEIEKLILDDDVTKKSGIYPYILTRDEKYLSIRAFSDAERQKVYEKQKGICPLCKGENKKKKWEIEEMEADHITPWHKGGKTIEENCQMLCKDCNRRKSGK